jgi:nucleotide-binding universal stress UspA family protein
VFRRILVGYHDTPGARQALTEAVHLARQEGAALVVVAVEGPLARFDGNTVGEVRTEHVGRQRDCRRWLRAAEAYADDLGVRARTEIRIGKLTWQLANAANAYHADLVVVGHTSRGMWRRLTGTTAGRVSRYTRCSVLIASPPRGPEARRLRGRSNGSG